MADTEKKTVAELREVIDATNDPEELDAIAAAEGPDGRKGVLDAVEKRRAQLSEADASADGGADEGAAAATAPTASASGKKLDETVPGGRYRVGGRLVNAHGKPLGE